MTQVQYGDMLNRIFEGIEAQLGVSVAHYSFSSWQQHEYKLNALTYDYDNCFQVTLCIWQDSLTKRCELVESPLPIVSPEEEAAFTTRLRDAVIKLINSGPSDESE